MAKKKVIRRKSALADDIRASWLEALDYARGKKTGAIVHRVTPRDTAARDARLKLGLTQREFASLIEVIKTEPKAVRRALGRDRLAG